MGRPVFRWHIRLIRYEIVAPHMVDVRGPAADATAPVLAGP